MDYKDTVAKIRILADTLGGLQRSVEELRRDLTEYPNSWVCLRCKNRYWRAKAPVYIVVEDSFLQVCDNCAGQGEDRYEPRDGGAGPRGNSGPTWIEAVCGVRGAK